MRRPLPRSESESASEAVNACQYDGAADQMDEIVRRVHYENTIGRDERIGKETQNTYNKKNNTDDKSCCPCV